MKTQLKMILLSCFAIILSTMLLTGCNTVQGAAQGAGSVVKGVGTGVGQTVQGIGRDVSGKGY